MWRGWGASPASRTFYYLFETQYLPGGHHEDERRSCSPEAEQSGHSIKRASRIVAQVVALSVSHNAMSPGEPKSTRATLWPLQVPSPPLTLTMYRELNSGVNLISMVFLGYF